MSATLYLKDEAETLRLGALLARELPPEAPYQVLLLDGPLGAGKTTLVRGLVQSLPGADKAEVSSPSFNLVNLYPTQPEVAHFDLYRLEFQGPDETLLEHLEQRNHLIVVEWISNLEPEYLPQSHLRLRWTGTGPGRMLAIEAKGDYAGLYFQRLEPFFYTFSRAPSSCGE